MQGNPVLDLATVTNMNEYDDPWRIDDGMRLYKKV